MHPNTIKKNGTKCKKDQKCFVGGCGAGGPSFFKSWDGSEATPQKQHEEILQSRVSTFNIRSCTSTHMQFQQRVRDEPLSFHNLIHRVSTITVLLRSLQTPILERSRMNWEMNSACI